jgi:uncharacterized protein (DUF302 family)
MTDYGRRIVVDLDFDAALRELTHALGQQGLDILARIDVRDHFVRTLAHDFRRYVLLEAWSPQLAFEALRNTFDAGMLLPTTFAVYELADGETAIAAREPLYPVGADAAERRHAPALAVIADGETSRVARVFEALAHASSPPLSNR